ncbi:MAG: hypothetical protein JOZ58_07980 [Acetobacteraceae bacterium]|nr:hypothetical protein [Acetobacteraceae bacterium]
MAAPLSEVPRRILLGSVAGLPFLTGAGWAAARKPAVAASPPPSPEPSSGIPESATLVAAGPEGSRIDRWARFIAAPLERALPTGTSLQATRAGGIDGVTGANKFEARVVPDGSTALLVPGTAAIAWLAGDPRAQFDAARWLPIMAGASPGVVVGRPGLGALVTGQRLRIAAGRLVGVDLPALLALDLMGVQAVPVLAGGDESTAIEAFAEQAADALFLNGARVPERAQELARVGARPLFSLGITDETGALIRDPLFPELPHVAELCSERGSRTVSGPLFQAWRATATASQLEFGLMLPQLTPASRVALWRRAAALATASPDLHSVCAADAIRALATPSAAVFTSGITIGSDSLLELRRWLAARYNWQPV